MAMDAKELAELIQQGIPGATVQIDDLKGDGEHYAAYVQSASFKGMSRIAQHQMVYTALQGKMGGQLHALAIHTKVTE